MMLTGAEILKRVKEGTIIISEFDEKRLNPNSYNLTLNNLITTYGYKEILDTKKRNETHDEIISEDGMLLLPGKLYLGSTNEYTESKDLIPCIDGRSSLGRLGINVHATAGFGDIGFKGKWTLEITVVQPVVIYPNIEIAQIYYYIPYGNTSIQYNGKYQNQKGTISSRMYKDFDKESKEVRVYNMDVMRRSLE